MPLHPTFDVGRDADTAEPDLPIIDTHHHLMPGRGRPAYLLPEFLADLATGHRVLATVHVGGGRPREPGEAEDPSVADTREQAKRAAEADALGGPRVGLGLVGGIDLTADDVAATLDAQLIAGAGRLRGVRHMTVWTEDAAFLPPGRLPPRDLAYQPAFRRGFAELAPRGLTFDAWCYYPQLGDIADLARTFPETMIVMDHCGGPLGGSTYASWRDEAYAQWRTAVANLATCENVVMKLGGLGMWTTGLPSVGSRPRASAERIADEQRPFLDVCIEAFGPSRCTFGSNYPIEAGVGEYHTIWNAFKLATSDYSPADREQLFWRTASRVYRLAVEP